MRSPSSHHGQSNGQHREGPSRGTVWSTGSLYRCASRLSLGRAARGAGLEDGAETSPPPAPDAPWAPTPTPPPLRRARTRQEPDIVQMEKSPCSWRRSSLLRQVLEAGALQPRPRWEHSPGVRDLLSLLLPAPHPQPPPTCPAHTAGARPPPAPGAGGGLSLCAGMGRLLRGTLTWRRPPQVPKTPPLAPSESLFPGHFL